MENVASKTKFRLDSNLGMFIRRSQDNTISTYQDMNAEEAAWVNEVGLMKIRAIGKNINISSCLGDNESNLEQLIQVEGQQLFSCSQRCFNITQKYLQKTLDVVRSFNYYKF